MDADIKNNEADILNNKNEMDRIKDEERAKAKRTKTIVDLKSDIIKAKFYKKNNTLVYIKTFRGRIFQGLIMDIAKEYIIIDDAYKRETIITFLEIDRFEKHINPDVLLTGETL